MTYRTAVHDRPPVHVLASESDLVGKLALQAERSQPVVSAMLLEEIERAELHDADTLPEGHARLGSRVTFVDEKSGEVREIELALPGDADIGEGRVSILTSIGAGLIGLRVGQSISWPYPNGEMRMLKILQVTRPSR